MSVVTVDPTSVTDVLGEPEGSSDLPDLDWITTGFAQELLLGEEVETASTLPEILGGKWRVSGKIGDGGFSGVYLGEHAILGMKVAIKLLRRRFTGSDVGRRLFHEEAMRVSRLDHPNILKVHDYGEEDRRPYLVTEYLTGKALHSLLPLLPAKTLSLEEGVEVVRQAAVALIRAHAGTDTGEPLVHLDLKPEHLFLQRVRGQLHVKVIDFGIAEIVSAPGGGEGPTGSARSIPLIAGTFPYMAPERWRGVVDPRCDIYSLGVILYEILAGRKPFQSSGKGTLGEESGEWRRLHESEPPTPPSRHRPGPRTAALRELDAIALRCLAKSPEERPQTAEELVKALEEWERKPRRTPKERGIHALKVLSLPLLVVALLGAGMLHWAPWESVDPPPEWSVWEPGRRASVQPSVFLGPATRSPPATSFQVLSCAYQSAALEILDEDGSAIGELPLAARDPSGRPLADSEGGLLPLPRRRRMEIGFPSWSQIAPLCGAEEGTERTVPARVVLRGPFWRALRSAPFNLRLDAKPPELREVVGHDWKPDGSAERCPLRILEEDASSTETLVFSEPVRLRPSSRATAPDDPPEGEVRWRMRTTPEVVQCTIPRGTSRVEVPVEDLAGNAVLPADAELCVTIRRSAPLPPARIFPAENVFLTNDSRLDLAWAARPGRVEVSVDGGRWEGTALEEPQGSGGEEAYRGWWHAAVELPFPEQEEDAPLEKKVDLRIWPDGVDPEAPPFDVDGILVRRLRRTLTISPDTGAPDNTVFVVKHGERVLPERLPERLYWKVSGWRTVSEAAGWDFIPEVSSTGSRLDLRREPSLSERGRYRLGIQASDEYGNASSWKDVEWSLGIDPLELLRLELLDAEGRRISCLHNAGCSCQAGKSRSVVLDCDLEYEFPDKLDWSLKVGSPERPRPVTAVLVNHEKGEPQEGCRQRLRARLRVETRELLGALDPGCQNWVIVRASDREIDKFSEISVSLDYDPPLRVVEWSPPSSTRIEAAGGRAEVRVRLAAPTPPIASLTIGGGPGRAQDGWHRASVAIGRTGTTYVRVKATRDGGCTLAAEETAFYSAMPVEGSRYVFRAKEGGTELALLYRKALGGFWYTAEGFWPKLLDERSRARTGNAGSSTKGVRLDDALRIVERLNGEFEDLLGDGGGKLRLMRIQDRREIAKRNAADGTFREWLDPDDPEIGSPPRRGWVAYAESAEVACKWANGNPDDFGGADRFPFRLVLEASDRNRFWPEDAESIAGSITAER